MTDTATSQAPTERPPQDVDEPLMIDTSGMNQGESAAMEVAEQARDQGSEQQGEQGSLGSGFFMGRFDPSRLTPFPVQTHEDQSIGDEMVQKVSAFLSQNLDAEKVDETRTIPKEVIDGLIEMGVFRMKVPKEYGGLGFSQVNYNRVIMTVASYCGSTAVLISAHQSIGVPQPLKMFGTPEQKQTYLPRISEGAMSAFALTEPDVGSDPAQMKTTATLSDDGEAYTLNGTKLWTTNGPIADLLVVMAQTAPKVVRGKERQQITAFVVEANSPGIEVIHRCDFMGIRGIQNGLLRFTNVKVPAKNVIWGTGLGLKLALKTLNTGRLTLPAACTGMAKACLSIVRRWGRERVQWGLPIGEHEVGQEKIAYISATTYAMEAVTWLVSHWADQNRDIRIEAAMAKLFCSEAAWKIVDQTMQFRGGRGYERAASLAARGEAPYPVERMMRDCRINTIIEGTSEIMRLFLAREAVDPHLRQAGDLLRDSAPWRDKFTTIKGLLRFYGVWYPKQLGGQCWSKSLPPGLGRVSRHMRYIERASHRLAAALFHAMVLHGPKLPRRQMLLGHLMDIGTELFAMAAVCAYVNGPQAIGQTSQNAEELADLFCRQSRVRISDHFRATRSTKVRRGSSVVKKVLADDLTWLESGIIQPGGEG